MDRIFVVSGLSQRMVDGIHVVTGALGYSGRWIAKNLIDSGVNVKTLTNAPRGGIIHSGMIYK